MGQEEPVVWVEDRDDDRRIGAGKVLTSADGADCGESAADAPQSPGAAVAEEG